jgi:hypothetical protein
MSDPEQDDEFEAYLKRRAPVDERLRSRKRLEPPSELDRIVIGNARKAIQGAAPLHVYRAPKWALPFSLAAILIISFAILLDLGVRARRREVMAQAPPVAQAMVTQQSAPSAPASTPMAVPPIATNPWPPGSPGAPALSNSMSAASHTGSPANDQARARSAHVEVAAKRSRKETYSEPKPAVSLAEISSGSRQSPALESIVVSAERRTQNDAASAAHMESGAQASDGVGSEPDPRVVTIDLSSALASAASSARAAIDGGPDPAAWLAEIEKIRSQGHAAQADREIKRFQKTYPEYPMPADMSDR